MSFDEHGVVIYEEHGRCKEPTVRRFEWAGVCRVCFKDRGLSSDVFYISTTDSEKPFMVPTEAQEGEAFWTALRERGLFPEEISAAAVRSTDGGFYCWPPEKEAKEKGPRRESWRGGRR